MAASAHYATDSIPERRDLARTHTSELRVGVRIAAITGALLLVLMWAASLPLANHPFLDDHIIYAFVLGGLALEKAGYTLGLGERWSRLDVVRRNPWLE